MPVLVEEVTVFSVVPLTDLVTVTVSLLMTPDAAVMVADADVDVFAGVRTPTAVRTSTTIALAEAVIDVAEGSSWALTLPAASIAIDNAPEKQAIDLSILFNLDKILTKTGVDG